MAQSSGTVGDKFLDDCSRAEQLSLAAMAQAPMPGVQGSAEQATVLSTVSRDAEKLALLEELKESIQRMERANAPTFVGTSPRNLDVFVFGNPMRLEDNAVAQRLAHLWQPLMRVMQRLNLEDVEVQ